MGYWRNKVWQSDIISTKFTLRSPNLPMRKQNKIIKCARTSLSLSLSLYTHTHTHTCVCAHTPACVVCACVHAHAGVCVCVCVCVCLFVCECVYIYLLAQVPCHLLSLWRLYSDFITQTKFIPNLSPVSLQTKPEKGNFRVLYSNKNLTFCSYPHGDKLTADWRIAPSTQPTYNL